MIPMFSLDRVPTLAPTPTRYLFHHPIPTPASLSIRCQRPRRSIDVIASHFSYRQGIVTIV
jgi:hypothetical protein